MPPRSYVRTVPFLRVVSTACSIAVAASRIDSSPFFRPSQSSIIWTARIIAIGLTSSFPACFGALPWIGSNIACWSPMFPLAAMPIPPCRTAARSVAMSPNRFDVTATSNLFGDIATDLAAVLQGGMGMAASGNIGEQHAMFEPIHGSAPKHAGKDEVNPIAMILAVQMMLDWLGRKKGDESMREAATAIEQGVETTLKKGTVLTYDLGGSAKCSEVGTAIASAVSRPRKKS